MVEDGDESWRLAEGDRSIRRRAAEGHASLDPREQLIYCLWVADDGMRNAGDLSPAANVHPDVLRDGQSAAQALGLPRSAAAFSLPRKAFEERYFDRFNSIVAELRAT